MKKFLVVLVILAATVVGSARDVQKTIKGSFDRIYLSSAFKVELIQGNKHSVEITVDDEIEEYLKAEIVQGTLRIGIQNGMPKTLRSLLGRKTLKATIVVPHFSQLHVSGACEVKAEGIFKSREIEVELYGASNLKNLNISANEVNIDASGASNFKNIVIETKECDIDLSGASNLNGDINANRASFDLSGASNVSIGGKINKADYEGSGACNIKAYEVDSKEVDVELSGASSARIYVTDDVNAELSGASSLYYRGPESVRMNSRKVSRGCGLHYEGNRK